MRISFIQFLILFLVIILIFNPNFLKKKLFHLTSFFKKLTK